MNFLIIGEGVWFSVRFSSFLLYSVQLLSCRNCKRLRDFEEIEISRHQRIRPLDSEQACIFRLQCFVITKGNERTN
jgi:hypothetical protein